MPATRTTHRSSSGKKLYAVRDAAGRFTDIQMYKRAHGADLLHRSKAERAKRRVKPRTRRDTPAPAAPPTRRAAR